MIGEPPFPISIDQLNAPTLSTALGQPVRSFQAERIGADRGMLGEIFLVTPEYEDGTTKPAGPTSVVCKFAALRDEALASAQRGGTHERELRCYDELLVTATVTTPKFHAGWYDPTTAHFLLIQQAVAADTSVDQVAGIEPELAGLVVGEAARLHHRFWQDPSLQERDWLPRLDDPRRVQNLTTLATNGWQPLCDLVGDALPGEQRRLGAEFPCLLYTSPSPRDS